MSILASAWSRFAHGVRDAGLRLADNFVNSVWPAGMPLTGLGLGTAGLIAGSNPVIAAGAAIVGTSALTEYIFSPGEALDRLGNQISDYRQKLSKGAEEAAGEITSGITLNNGVKMAGAFGLLAGGAMLLASPLSAVPLITLAQGAGTTFLSAGTIATADALERRETAVAAPVNKPA